MLKKDTTLPQFLRPYFWDVKFEDIDRKNSKHFVIKRVLDRGEIKDIKFLKNGARLGNH